MITLYLFIIFASAFTSVSACISRGFSISANASRGFSISVNVFRGSAGVSAGSKIRINVNANAGTDVSTGISASEVRKRGILWKLILRSN
jgi:hypothetical protein